MQKIRFSPPLQVLGRTLVLIAAAGACFLPVSDSRAAIQSGVYQTDPAATVEERGDLVPNSPRIVPWSVTLTLDLDADPSLTSVIPNAVLEGGGSLRSHGAELAWNSIARRHHSIHRRLPPGTNSTGRWIWV